MGPAGIVLFLKDLISPMENPVCQSYEISQQVAVSLLQILFQLCVCLALNEKKLKYESMKRTIFAFLYHRQSQAPLVSVFLAHIKKKQKKNNDLHDWIRGIAISTALLVLLFLLFRGGNILTLLSLCALALFRFWFATCMYITASASVFLAAGLSYFPRFSSQ